MGAAPAFASASEALDMVRSGLRFLANADATELSPEEQAEILRDLEADKILADAARAGMGLRDLAELAAEILARCRPDEPDQDPDDGVEDRSVTLQTTFQGAGVLHGDLTPECASIVGTVLDATT